MASPFQGLQRRIGLSGALPLGEPGAVQISDEVIRYICDAVNQYFAKQVAPEDVVCSYAGVRPLFDDASATASEVTLEYVLDLESADGWAPLLSVFGGKIITYRCLAEEVLERRRRFYPAWQEAWSEHAPLPGGNLPAADFEGYLRDFRLRHQWLPEALARHYASTYGTRAERALDGARGIDELGEHMGNHIYQAVLCYLVAHEWAQTAEDYFGDVLGLSISQDSRARVEQWLTRQGGNYLISETVGRERTGGIRSQEAS